MRSLRNKLWVDCSSWVALLQTAKNDASGDLGSVAADGLVRISGRAKDLIIHSGHNIDPAVIEDAAAIHPQVVTSAAVGRPDVYAGEIPTLYVVLRENSPEMLADLHEHVRYAVPEPPARPKSIVPLSALPMTPQAKLTSLRSGGMRSRASPEKSSAPRRRLLRQSSISARIRGPAAIW
jgi:acyl-coenzyme A synthetase/AMP-(fatty) acid ligase